MFEQEFETFRTVADSGNITLAAKRLHMSQPGISLQIHNLESRYGLRFFNRTNKGVSLTRAGRIFYDYVCKVIELSCCVQQELNEITDDKRGTINLGATLTIGEYIIPNILAYLYKIRPDIDFKVKVANTEVIFEDMLSKNISISLIEGPVPGNKDIRMDTFWHDELVVVVPFNHPLGNRTSITVNELCGQRIIAREIGSGTRRVMEMFLQERGVNLDCLNITMELGSTQAIKEVVAGGLGIAVISALTVRKECDQHVLKMLRIQDAPVTRPLNLLVATNTVPTREERFFIDFLHNADLLSEVIDSCCFESHAYSIDSK